MTNQITIFSYGGANTYLADALGCPVGIGKEDALLLEQGIKRKVHGKGIWGTVYASAANRNILHKKIAGIKPEIILKPDMSLTEYGVEGKVIALPRTYVRFCRSFAAIR